MSEKKEKIIGIDLGTTNSAAAVMMGGKVTIIPSAEGPTIHGKMFPSVVAFTKDGQILVGEPAKRQAAMNPERTIREVKRKMGTDYKYKIDGKEYTPQEISAMILRKIKQDAESFLGEPIKKVVITVPAYFNDNQRTATKDAGAIAGLEVVRIINEPTAAALAYGLDKAEEQLIAVLDLGGGTFDVTIMEIGDGVFQVKSTSGDTQLGGVDMDNRIVDWIVEEFKKQHGIDLTKDKMAMVRVREAAEKAKIELSTLPETTIHLPFIASDEKGPKHLQLTLTRSKMEELIRDVLDRLEEPILRALRDAGAKPSDIKKIICVGGPTRMPCVREKFKQILGREPERGVDPMECVAAGAAIQGAIIAGEVKDVVLVDVTPLSLGIETLGGVFTKLIERNTPIPVRKSRIFTTAQDYQTSVEIHVLQGERPMAADNISLGRFTLTGIPPAPRGIPQIEVTFDIDHNGILNVSAKDLATGKEQSIVITAPHKLSKEEIERKIKEAEMYAEQDRKRRELAEARNNADSIIYSVERAIGELGEKLEKEKVEELRKKISELREAMKGEDTDRIKKITEELSKSSGELFAKIYAQKAAEMRKEKEGKEGVDVDYEEKERK